MFSTVARRLVKLIQGGELPEREFRLNFSAPPQQSKINRPELSVGKLAKEWREYTPHPILLLESEIAYLSQLNRYRVATAKRLALLELALDLGAPLINEAFHTYRNEDGFPESHKRREALEQILELLAQLLHGYMHVFDQDYQLPDYRYAWVRKRLQLAGLRILELVRSQQLLMALRYQKLPAASWQAINQVFFVLYHYETVNQPQQLVGCLRIQLRESEIRDSRRQMATAQQLYVPIQLLGMMDLVAWPVQEIGVADAYIRGMEDRVVVLPDTGAQPPSGHVVTWFGHDGPPQFSRKSNKSGLFFDVGALRKRVNEDHFLLFSGQETPTVENISAPLSVLDEHGRALFVERMRSRLSPRQRRDQRNDVTDHREVFMYAGFMEVHRQLTLTRRPGKSSTKQSLSDMLAGRSSILADDARDVREQGQWEVVNESEGGLQLKATETPFTNPLAMGKLLLFRDMVAAPESLQVGYIGRLMRPKKGQIGVAIIKLGPYAESVAAQDESLQKTGKAWPAILLRTQDGRWQLIFHAKQHLQSGLRLSLRRGTQVLTIQLGSFVLVQREFTVYAVMDHENQLSRP